MPGKREHSCTDCDTKEIKTSRDLDAQQGEATQPLAYHRRRSPTVPVSGLIIAANNLVKIQMAEAAIGGGCREAKKRKEVDVKSLLTEEYTEKKVKANFWEQSEDAYVEDWRPSGRSAARGRSSPRRTRQWLTGCWQGWTSCCTSSLIKGSSSAGCVKHVRG